MEIQIGPIILQIINFGVLIFLMTKFLYRPIVKYLEDRNNKIEAGMKAAQDNLAAQAKLEELKQQELIKAEKTAAAIMEEARQKASTTSKALITEAKRAAQAEVQKEYQLLQEKIKTERYQLKADIADLVIDTTKSVLEGALTPANQQALLKHQLKQLKAVEVKRV